MRLIFLPLEIQKNIFSSNTKTFTTQKLSGSNNNSIIKTVGETRRKNFQLIWLYYVFHTRVLYHALLLQQSYAVLLWVYEEEKTFAFRR